MARITRGMIAFIRKIRFIRGQNVFVRRMGGGSAALCPLWVGSVSSVTPAWRQAPVLFNDGPSFSPRLPTPPFGRKFLHENDSEAGAPDQGSGRRHRCALWGGPSALLRQSRYWADAALPNGAQFE